MNHQAGFAGRVCRSLLRAKWASGGAFLAVGAAQMRAGRQVRRPMGAACLSLRSLCVSREGDRTPISLAEGGGGV